MRGGRRLAGGWIAVAMTLASALALAPRPLPAAPAPAPGFIGVDGERFVTADGRTLMLKGINLGNWLVPEGYMWKFERARTPTTIAAATARILGVEASERFWRDFRDVYVTGDDVRFIASAGFNVVRVPLHWAMLVGPDGRPGPEAPAWTLLDRLIDWCREAGVRVVLDLHAAPGGQTGHSHDDGPGYPLLFYVPAHQALTADIWRAIALRYRDEPVVLGYDLLNEPIAPFHDTHLLNPRLEALYRRITAAIREVDRRHVIFLGGAQWNTNLRLFGRPFDDRVAYTYHSFWSATTRVTIQEHIDVGNRWRVPLWLGESGEFTDAWTREFRELHDAHGIGWAFWAYKNLDTLSSVVAIERPPGWASVIAVADAGRRVEPADIAPHLPTARSALAAYLVNARLQNCRVNAGYLQALGLSVPEILPDDVVPGAVPVAENDPGEAAAEGVP